MLDLASVNKILLFNTCHPSRKRFKNLINKNGSKGIHDLQLHRTAGTEPVLSYIRI